MKYVRWRLQKQPETGYLKQKQPNPNNMNTKGAIESVRINGMSVLCGLNQRKCKGFLSQGTKQTVCNKEVSLFNGYL